MILPLLSKEYEFVGLKRLLFPVVWDGSVILRRKISLLYEK
jgi:hypothetical protein